MKKKWTPCAEREMTPERVKVWKALVERASGLRYLDRPTVITYGEMSAESGRGSWPRYAQLIGDLAAVSSYELRHGRPMLSALVVAKSTQRPGPGFFDLARVHDRVVPDSKKAETAFWVAELTRCASSGLIATY